MLTTKLGRMHQDDSDIECMAAQAFPAPEEALHNLESPEDCWCSPDIWLYFDEQGQVEFSEVKHKWRQ